MKSQTLLALSLALVTVTALVPPVQATDEGGTTALHGVSGTDAFAIDPFDLNTQFHLNFKVGPSDNCHVNTHVVVDGTNVGANDNCNDVGDPDVHADAEDPVFYGTVLATLDAAPGCFVDRLPELEYTVVDDQPPTGDASGPRLSPVPLVVAQALGADVAWLVTATDLDLYDISLTFFEVCPSGLVTHTPLNWLQRA